MHPTSLSKAQKIPNGDVRALRARPPGIRDNPPEEMRPTITCPLLSMIADDYLRFLRGDRP